MNLDVFIKKLKVVKSVHAEDVWVLFFYMIILAVASQSTKSFMVFLFILLF